jgi:serine O-acetyltransferase
LGLNKFSVVFLFRIASTLYGRNRIATAFAKLVTRINSVWNSSEISPEAVIGAGLHIPHPIGIVCGVITAGRNLTICQNATIGLREPGLEHVRENFAAFGDNVSIGPATIILGRLKIGDKTTIAANSVVMEDIPAGATVRGNPARIVETKAETGGCVKKVSL